MRECEVLLINLPVTFWYKKELAKVNSMPPLGILYIATVLNKNSYNTKILDLAVEYFDTKELKEYLLRCNPRLIGLSTYCESWNSQIALCELIKETLPECKIFAGGAFATFTYNEMLTKKLVDYVVLGEGEYSTLKLCKIIDGEESIDEIDGIAYLKDDEVVVRNEFTRITNLDELPIPDRDLIDVNKYLIPYTINTARGCPGDCIFCSSRAFWGKKVYLRSASNVFNEVMHLYEKYKTNQFLLADDTFTASKKRCLDFCELVKDSGIKFTWGCESRADVVDEELIKRIHEAGCRKIQFGLESADNDVLKKLKKKVTVEQIEEAVKIAYKYDMHITASFIIGHAFDTKETIVKTLNFAKYIRDKYGVMLAASVNTPFPGTEQYYSNDKYGINIHTKDWNKFHLNNAIISTDNLTRNEIRYYFQQAIKLASNQEISMEE